MIEPTTGERLAHTANWLKQEAERLRPLRDSVKQDLELGTLPNTLPEAADAATVVALIDPLAAAMVRLSKTLASQHGGKGRAKRK